MVNKKFSLLIFAIIFLMIISFSKSKPTFQQTNFPLICRKKSDCPEINQECVTVLSGYGYCIDSDAIKRKKSHDGVDEMSVENYLSLNPKIGKVSNKKDEADFYGASFQTNGSKTTENEDNEIKNNDKDSYAPIKFAKVRHDEEFRKIKNGNNEFIKSEDLRKSFENWNSVDDIHLMHIRELNDENDDQDDTDSVNDDFDDDEEEGEEVLWNFMKESDKSDRIKTVQEFISDDEEDPFDDSE